MCFSHETKGVRNRKEKERNREKRIEREREGESQNEKKTIGPVPPSSTNETNV